MKLAVVGAGWAGLTAAVRATQAGHHVTVFEAARTLGGRARTVAAPSHDTPLDNGQHILIGAYLRTLAVMQDVGVDIDASLHRTPLSLRFADGLGVALPNWPAPFDVLAGIALARGWSVGDKLSLIQTAGGWQRRKFVCGAKLTVAQLCAHLPATVRHQLIDPLCVSALNTPAEAASASVFLRVLRDALFTTRGGSNLLLPKKPLGELLPEPAAAWLKAHGATLHLGGRVQTIANTTTNANAGSGSWRVDDEPFDHVLLATPPWETARLVRLGVTSADGEAWAACAEALRFEAIACVYAFADATLPQPMLALRCGPGAPAQFVFDRGLLGGPKGLLAFVVSASQGDRDALQDSVIAQATAELRHLGVTSLRPLTTVVERRATFACTPGLDRPSMRIAPGLSACGDYIEGPYPATLEGAVMSAEAAVAALA